MINAQTQQMDLIGRSVVRGLLIADPSFAVKKIHMIRAVRYVLGAAGMDSSLRESKAIVEAELEDWYRDKALEELRANLLGLQTIPY